MKSERIVEEIRIAKDGVADAENDLAGLLKAIDIAPRADKTTISGALRRAFEKLRTARDHLEKLEKRVGREGD